MEPAEVKDRILENISLSVKKLQSYFAACEDETPAIRNHDKVLQRLCEHLDHALLYGLQDLSSGYWVLVVHFTRREAVKQIEGLQHVATNLGRSRAWLYLALNENSLESYLRLFQENLSLLHKYYVKNALVCSHDHLTLFLTLVSGLEFIRFDLDLDAPYLDLAPYMPDYYKPQYLLDFEDRLPSSVHGSDSLSLNSFNSVTSTNLEWDDSAIAPSSEDYDFGDVFPAMQTMPSRDWEDGDLTDTLSCPRSTASEANGSKGSVKSPTQRHNPFNEEKSDMPSSTETTPVHTASQEKAEATPEGTDQSESCTELEVIRLAKKKKTGKKKRAKHEEPVTAPAPAAPEASGDSGVNGLSDREEPPRGDGPGAEPSPGGQEEGAERSALGQLALRIPEMKDTSMESVGQPLSKVMDRLNGQLDPGGAWSVPLEPPGQSFRTGTPGETPDGSSSGDFSEGISAPMDFYRFTIESPNAAAPGGGHHDTPGPGQPPYVSGSREAPEEESREGEAVGAVEESGGASDEPQTGQADTTEPQALGEPKKEQPSPSPSSAEDSGVEEGQGSPSELTHPSEFRVDNNHLLLLMIHVFRENEEQLFRMIRMSTGHMEGNLQLIYVLLTDCYVYLIRKGAAEKPYMVEEAVSYNELDYISILPALLEVSHDQRVPGATVPQYPHRCHHGETGTGKVCGPGIQMRGEFGPCSHHCTGDSLPLTSRPDSCRPATWLCVSMALSTGKTPWTRRWDLPAIATPPLKTRSPRMASCTTRQGPPTWARSSGRPASWCSAMGSCTSTRTARTSPLCSPSTWAVSSAGDAGAPTPPTGPTPSR
ncbi:pleckstrin homology domain-containing family M member 2 isoform 5-T5 [Amazona ochrocephala]